MSKYPIVDGVMTYPDGREECMMKTLAGRMEYDRRRNAMAVRQLFKSAIGGADLRIWGAQFDHQNGRGANGSNRDDRIEVDGEWFNAALTPNDNMAKGSKRYHWQNGLYVPCKAGEQ